MTDGRPERIDLTRAEDPRDVAHRAVACLAQGGVVGLPTETTYALAASVLQTGAVDRLWGLSRVDDDRRPALCLKGAEEVADWVPDLTVLGRRLSRRAWPGPVTLRFAGSLDRGLLGRLPEAVGPRVLDGGTFDLCAPAQPILREILRFLPGPLLLTTPAGSGRTDPSTPESLNALADLDLILDEGPTRERGMSTIVRVDGASWTIVREGVVRPDELARMAGMVLLFICTGNTCRSPMAEAICKVLLAQRLGCPVDQLESRGFVVASAGIAASPGQRAALDAIEVIRARGGSLLEHSSRQVDAELIAQADWIITMTRDHRNALLAHMPEASARIRLLHSEGGDVEDPIGADRQTYLRTAQAIEEQLGILIDELVP